MLRFNVLGDLEIIDGVRLLRLPGQRARKVLALLVLRRNRIVEVGSLVEEVWGDNPPAAAVGDVRTLVDEIGETLEREAGPDAAGVLVSNDSDHELRLADDQVDARQFERLVAEGRTALSQGRADQAAFLLRRGLSLFTGAVLANVTAGRLLRAHAAHLEEDRMRAIELRVEADLLLGQHRRLVPELRSLVALHPRNEWFREQLILALSRSGWRSEAREAYSALRRMLREELGLGPNGMRRLILGAV